MVSPCYARPGRRLSDPHGSRGLPRAEAVCQRRKNILRLPRDQLLSFRAGARQAAHGLSALGQLDQHHADVFHYGQQHLAQTLYLLVVIAFLPFPFAQGFRLAEFPNPLHARDTLNQIANICAKIGLQLFCPAIQMLRRRMQDGCGYRFAIHAHGGQYPGCPECVPQQRDASQLRLPVIERPGQFHGAEYHLGFGWGERLDQGIQPGLDIRAILHGQGGESVLNKNHEALSSKTQQLRLHFSGLYLRRPNCPTITAAGYSMCSNASSTTMSSVIQACKGSKTAPFDEPFNQARAGNLHGLPSRIPRASQNIT